MSIELAVQLAIGLPLGAGVVALLIPRQMALLTKLLALAVTAVVAWATFVMFRGQPFTWTPGWLGGLDWFGLDSLGGLIMLGAGFFSLALAVYSVGFLDDEEVSARTYYANFLWVVGATCGAILARDLMVLVGFWALMGIPFFLLINMGSEGADLAAKKTLIVLGGSDSLMILGVAIIFSVTGRLNLFQGPLMLEGMNVVACLCLAAAALAKAGAVPLHSWVPDAAATAPVPAVALLPASLDKLLGIYLFARITMGLFLITPAMQGLFVLIGAVTIVTAVMAALMQHNVRRLLGFHAVSQVGYMVLGIATGTAVGVIGGLFHMLNNTIYKSCLFLTTGAAERRTGERDLDRMGGLARLMPVTFGCTLVAAFAISGIPPLNGFASKWMVYHGVIRMAQQEGYIWLLALVAAMFGSALTLASFVKVLHSVFLGQPQPEEPQGRSPNVLMGLPMVVLAILCIVFGVFAYSVPVRHLLRPAVPMEFRADFAQAAWQPGLATVLLLVALAAGLVVYLIGALGAVREDEAYIGGEPVRGSASYHFSGVEFYRTIAGLPTLETLYRHAEAKWYDIYDLGKRFVAWVGVPLQAFHSGLLLTYVAWCVLGLVVLLWFFFRLGVQ